MMYEAEGTIHEIFDTQNISDKFRKREFVVKMEDNGFENYIRFQLTQDRCDLMNHFNKDEEVKVGFVLQGKPYNKPDGETIYFTNLNVLKIEKQEGTGDFNQLPSKDYDPNMDVPPPGTGDAPPADEDDDLPF